VITSQIPIKQWYDIIGNSTLADAILDRIVHKAYRIELSGETLRDRLDDTVDGASLPQNQTTAL
jgi:DNA replication protein DnaC